jgi:hypothetical protein
MMMRQSGENFLRNWIRRLPPPLTNIHLHFVWESLPEVEPDVLLDTEQTLKSSSGFFGHATVFLGSLMRKTGRCATHL